MLLKLSPRLLPGRALQLGWRWGNRTISPFGVVLMDVTVLGIAAGLGWGIAAGLAVALAVALTYRVVQRSPDATEPNAGRQPPPFRQVGT